MYLITNIEKDYKKNVSKITLAETPYNSLVKLISNQEGNLTEEMLLNIKNKQDLTYNKLYLIYNSLYIFFISHGGYTIFPNFNIDLEIEYTSLKSNEISPYEEGNINYVDMELFTKIMKNENSLKNKTYNIKNDLWNFKKFFINNGFSIINIDFSNKGISYDGNLGVRWKNFYHPNSNHAVAVVTTKTIEKDNSIPAFPRYFRRNHAYAFIINLENSNFQIIEGGYHDSQDIDYWYADVEWIDNLTLKITNVINSTNFGFEVFTLNGNLLPLTDIKNTINLEKAIQIYSI